MSSKTNNVIIDLFDVKPFCLGKEIYQCGDWVIDSDGVLYKSRINDNKRHVDDGEAWTKYGKVGNLLDLMVGNPLLGDLQMPIYSECEGAGCTPMFKKGQCVLVQVPVLDQATCQPLTDKCGVPQFELKIFQSLIDKNNTNPIEGSTATPRTWDGGYNVCEYFNRPVGTTQDGCPISPMTPAELLEAKAVTAPLSLETVAGAGCNGKPKRKLALMIARGLQVVNAKLEAFIGNGLTFGENGDIQVKAADKSIVVTGDGIKVGQLGVDRNGKPVMAGACLVTCDTDLHVTGIDDTGTSTVITLSDGSTITGLEIDKDDYVKTFTQKTLSTGDIELTIVMQSGATHNVVIPKPASQSDSFVTGVSVTPTSWSLTRNNGLPAINMPYFTAYSAWVESIQNPGQTIAGDLPKTTPVLTNDTSNVVFTESTFGIFINETGWYNLDHFSQFSFFNNRINPAPTDETGRHDVYAIKPDASKVVLNTILQNPDWESNGGTMDALHPQTYFKTVYLEKGWEVRQKISKLNGGGNLNPAFLDARRNRFRITSLAVYPKPFI